MFPLQQRDLAGGIRGVGLAGVYQLKHVCDVPAALELSFRGAERERDLGEAGGPIGERVPISHQPDVATSEALDSGVQNVAGSHIVKLHDRQAGMQAGEF